MNVSQMDPEYERRRAAWIGLSMMPKWGSAKVWKAVGPANDPVPVWRQHRPLPGFDPVADILAAADQGQVTIVTVDDAVYPRNLRSIPAPPPVLYIKGRLIAEDAAAIAVVGSRQASGHGLQLARRLARDLAGCGLTVVSGMAVGIDTAAHEGALAAQNGRTLAVLGCGVDIIYPRRNRGLAGRIEQNGAIVSQFPCGMPPLRQHFPMRNRIMAGITLGTLVVEARVGSGALITAGYASALSRHLFVCPADPEREHARGSNQLLQTESNEVHLVLSASDVIFHLREALKDCQIHLAAGPASADVVAFTRGAPAAQRRLAGELWRILTEGPCNVDEMVLRTDTTVAAIRSCLAQLEAAGCVGRQPGELYSLR